MCVKMWDYANDKHISVMQYSHMSDNITAWYCELSTLGKNDDCGVYVDSVV